MDVSACLAILALIGYIISFTSARTIPSWPNARDLLPQDPTHDPFYQPPAGFESEAPGSILRNRRIVAAFFGLVPNPVEVHQLLYRTTAINGSAIATATTIFKPWFPKTDRFVSWQSAYNSASEHCNPSYQWQLLAPATDVIAPRMMLTTVEAYLGQGYIVASPDYEGPDAAFGAGRLSGMAVLDGMRAVTNYHDTLGLASDNPMIVGDGYSGAGVPTGWAAALQPTYAPELNIKGWSIGAAPVNLTGALEYMDGTLFSGFVPAFIAGLAKPSAYGAQLNPVIDRIFTAEGREKLKAAAAQCPLADTLTFLSSSIFSTDIQKLGPGLFNEPTFADVLSQNIMGVHKSETPTAPVFLFHALHDEILPHENASALADSWCNDGASVDFVTFDNGGHAAVELIALPDIFKFVDAAFEGHVKSGCSRSSELRDALDPLALGANLEPVLMGLLQELTNAPNQDNVVF